MWDIQRDHNDLKEAKCPQCGELMANMGLDFEAPKKDSVKEWQHIMDLYSVGLTFHSCGCSGPGYIPKDNERLLAYFEEIKTNYNCHLLFWRNRTEPTTEKEIQREHSKHWTILNKVPSELQPKKGAIKNEVAKNYWISRIIEVEKKIATLHSKTKKQV